MRHVAQHRFQRCSLLESLALSKHHTDEYQFKGRDHHYMRHFARICHKGLCYTAPPADCRQGNYPRNYPIKDGVSYGGELMQ